MDELAALDRATRQHQKTKAAHERSQEAVADAVVAALKAGERPTDVAAHSPFTAAYVRRIARDHGIGPAPRGPKKKAGT